MKVVLFRGIGSFGLSPEAIQMLIDKYQIPVVDLSKDESTFIPPDPPFLCTWNQPFQECIYPGSFHLKEWRSDPRLVDVVETLGNRAWKTVWCNDRLEVVEIPDDVKWDLVEDETGSEQVHEKHRVW